MYSLSKNYSEQLNSNKDNFYWSKYLQAICEYFDNLRYKFALVKGENGYLERGCFCYSFAHYFLIMLGNYDHNG